MITKFLKMVTKVSFCFFKNSKFLFALIFQKMQLKKSKMIDVFISLFEKVFAHRFNGWL